MYSHLDIKALREIHKAETILYKYGFSSEAKLEALERLIADKIAGCDWFKIACDITEVYRKGMEEGRKAKC